MKSGPRNVQKYFVFRDRREDLVILVQNPLLV